MAATMALMGSATAIRKQNEASEMSLVILVVLHVRTDSFPLGPCENQIEARQKERRRCSPSLALRRSLRNSRDNLHHMPRAGIHEHDILAPHEVFYGAGAMDHDHVGRQVIEHDGRWQRHSD